MDIKPSHRRLARRYALQAMYQWEMSRNAISDIEAEFRTNHNFAKVDDEYFKELIYEIPKNLPDVEALFSPHLNLPLAELDPIELSVLRIATYELSKRLDVPYRVIINEALDLTKIFGTIEGFKFVNAVLDKVARDLRQLEINS